MSHEIRKTEIRKALMQSDWKGKKLAIALLSGLGLALGCFSALAQQSSTAPKFEFDPGWPKPLPNKWRLGGITGLAVDRDDTVWLYNRPNDLSDAELEAELTPPLAECCVRPPSMIHIDKKGNVIGWFEDPQGHGMAIDKSGFAYLGQDTVRKYNIKTGKLAGEVPRTSDRIPGSGGRFAEPSGPRIPGRGSGLLPGFGFAAPAGGGLNDSSVIAARQAAMAAFRSKYPPTTPMIVGALEEVRLDELARELYAADNYLGGRVMVFDLDTFQFKRGWGAYGHKLSEITTDDADRAYTPGGPMPKEFRGHLTLNISNDGLIYAADRLANRIHVTTKEGKFLKEFVLAPQTGICGSTGGVMFSPDKPQKFLYISDFTNNHIWFLNREDGKVMGKMGTTGENGGQFFGLHMIAVDSKGVIYTGEVFPKRVQRFVPAR